MIKRILSVCLAALIFLCPVAHGDAKEGFMSLSTNVFNTYLELGEENIAISPVSAYLALLMAMRGADGETLSEFEEVLGLSEDEIISAARGLQNALIGATGDDIRLILANALWADENRIDPDPDYTADLAAAFDAEINLADFSTDDIAAAINQWISEKTEGMIPEMIGELEEDDVLILVNTLFMDAQWLRSFDSADTKDGEFTLKDGTAQNARLMNRYGAYVDCFFADDYESAVLPYQGENLAFVALRPLSGNLEGFSLTDSTFTDVLENAETAYVDLSMPKFETRFRTEMSSMFSHLGLSSAFSPSANFTRFGKSEGNIYLGKVLQEVLMRVDEDGTVAAAATAIVAKTTSIELEPPRTLSFTTPFIYAVVDVNTGTPLFIGTFDRP